MTNIPSEQTVPVVDWHYSTDGKRVGPVTEAQVHELIKSHQITDESQVWNKSMADWQPILNSKFVDLVRDPNAPPPLTGAAVSNTIIWILAFAPLIGACIEGFVSGFAGVQEESLWIITLGLNVLLTYMDEKKLKAAGHDTSKMGSIWLIPVYLFKRAKVLRQNYAYLIVWCVLFGVMLLA